MAGTVAAYKVSARFRSRRFCYNLVMKPQKKSVSKYWSGEVTKKSNALDLDEGVFRWDDPKRIARSLRRSALRSDRRKGTAFQSAMSMLNFYINRAGKNLPVKQKRVLNQAKEELRILFRKK